MSNHKHIYHIDTKDNKRSKNDEDNLYHCRYCEKTYTACNSRWQHEKTCSSKNTTQTDDNIVRVLTEKCDNLKDEVISLQKKLLSSNRLTTRTFKAVNKILMNNSKQYMINKMNHSQMTNSLNTNSNNITNNIQQICNIGSEELSNILTTEQKKQIMNSRMKVLDKIIEMTHCGDYLQFKNAVITNLKDDFAYKYDSNKGYFVTVKKNDLLDDVFTYRTLNIEEIYEELQNGNKIDSRTKEIIKRFLDNCESDEPYEDVHGVKYPNFKTYKKDSIKILLYNHQEKITRDISQLINETSSQSRELV